MRPGSRRTLAGARERGTHVVTHGRSGDRGVDKVELLLHTIDATTNGEGRKPPGDERAPGDKLALAISDLEARLFEESGLELTAVERMVSDARASGDNALHGRALCVLARSQIAHGQHEVALVTADEGLRAFAAVEAAKTQAYAAFHAEMFRAAGSALLKLGRLAEALPKLEEAIRIAQAGVDAPSPEAPNATVISAVSALIRSLTTLGIALFAVRETDTAIDVYNRAMTVADAYPEAYEHFLEDVMLAHWNLTDALHERVKQERLAGDFAAAERDIEAARKVIEAQAWRVGDGADDGTTGQAEAGRLSASARGTYYAAYGQHLLINGQPARARAIFERGLVEFERRTFTDDWAIADAQAGIMQAALAAGSAHDALRHSSLALEALDRHDESSTRAIVLLARAQAYHALGEHEAAFGALEQHHALRASLEAAAAQTYARHMTARLGLERARADAESHRRIAEMLEALGKIGQEITANLDTDTVVRMVHRHVGALLPATTFTVWLLDDAGDYLTLSFGIEDDRPLTGPNIPLDHPQSFAARAVRERRETVVDATTSQTELRRLSGGTRPMKAALFEPLIVAERILGVISVQSDEADAYSANERLIFRTLTTYGAIALDNAAAYRKLAQTVITLQSTQSELAIRTAEYERLSMTDPLTGVANRRHLHERAAVEIAESRRKESKLAVAMFDIDHFKQVNDSHGHAVGDVVLQVVARIAKDWLRPADFIARVGGEEFALLLPGVGIEDALAIAERIRSSIEATPIVVDETTVRVTSSFGVATFDASIDTLDNALSRADAALYFAKRAGRNRVHIGA